jgi:hypothetical protein
MKAKIMKAAAAKKWHQQWQCSRNNGSSISAIHGAASAALERHRGSDIARGVASAAGGGVNGSRGVHHRGASLRNIKFALGNARVG